MIREIVFTPPPRPSIAVALRVKPQVVEIAIQNTGPELPETYLDLPVQFVVHPHGDSTDWASLGVRTPRLTSRSLQKTPKDHEDRIAQALVPLTADVTLGIFERRGNALAAWALHRAANDSPQNFANFLRTHASEPVLMHSLVRMAPELFTRDFIETLLPSRARAVARATVGTAEANALWRTGCRMVEGYIKHLLEHPPEAGENPRLKCNLRPKHLPNRLVGAVNMFEQTERDLLELCAKNPLHRKIIAEWFCAATTRRLNSPAFKRGPTTQAFLTAMDHVSDTTAPRGGVSRYWDRAYVHRESVAWQEFKQQGQTGLKHLGRALGAVASSMAFSGGIGLHGTMPAGHPLKRQYSYASSAPSIKAKAAVRAEQPAAQEADDAPEASGSRATAQTERRS